MQNKYSIRKFTVGTAMVNMNLLD
ncbi:YSIRK-type signal peptide-containing protein [Abyssicoccus albus]